MYLNHFRLKELPFSLTPDTEFFCLLPNYQAALNVLLLSLRQGEGFIKISGEVGTGKTLLCRVLLEKLQDEFLTAYIPNPDLNSVGLRRMLAQELGIEKPFPENPHELLELIHLRLIELSQQNKKVVLLLDEAQALSNESLEALRLLTNLETSKNKLLQIVLFAQPELNARLEQRELRQLKQRITFSYHIPSLTVEEMEAYLRHRLAIAGNTLEIFTTKAKKLLYRASRGIPRLVNILSHKAMLVSYGRGEYKISNESMMKAIKDTESVRISRNKVTQVFFGIAFLLVALAILITIYRIKTGVL